MCDALAVIVGQRHVITFVQMNINNPKIVRVQILTHAARNATVHADE